MIHWHLTGADDAGEPFTMGVYPMLLDKTSHLLAVDFDGKTWGDDASAYLSTCTRRGVPAALERSRSGNGGHVWLFFDMGRKSLKAALARAAEHVPGQVLLATGRFFGEGFDNARLDTLFLTMPVSWRGTIARYVGRLHRLHEHKQDVRVYDYADLDVPMLVRMFDKRCRGYEAVGYSISLPASAAPGWPVGIPLPADGTRRASRFQRSRGSSTTRDCSPSGNVVCGVVYRDRQGGMNDMRVVDVQASVPRGSSREIPPAAEWGCRETGTSQEDPCHP